MVSRRALAAVSVMLITMLSSAVAGLDATPIAVPTDFRFKPFVAMVSYLADSVLARSLQDGQTVLG